MAVRLHVRDGSFRWFRAELRPVMGWEGERERDEVVGTPSTGVESSCSGRLMFCLLTDITKETEEQVSG